MQVICATIAFGMGINKPNVRFRDPLRSAEEHRGYYQGRRVAPVAMVLPSECLLLLSPGDRVKQMRFIDEKPNPEERAIARAQLEQMIPLRRDRDVPAGVLAGLWRTLWSADLRIGQFREG